MKNILNNILDFIIILLFLPILILIFIFWIVPVVVVDSIKERRSNKIMDKREELEQQVYGKMCASCPRAKQCHEEATTCDMYAEALENEGQDDY